MSQPNEGMYEVVWPRARKSTGVALSLARRPGTLEGKTIGELWNRVFFGDRIFPMLEKELSGRYPGIRFINHEVFGPIHGKNEVQVLANLPARFRQDRCDALIAGNGC